MKKSIYFLLLVVVFLFGCARDPINVPVKIYNVDNGDVFTAVFKWTGRQGSVSTITPNGSQCSGEYFTQNSSVSGSSESWGNIYGWGYSGFLSASNSFYANQGSELGTAILRCQDRKVIQCEYIANRDIHGNGFCRDNQNNKYRFMF
jgi:hypothetical protein